jgi:hypothetical protein
MEGEREREREMEGERGRGRESTETHVYTLYMTRMNVRCIFFHVAYLFAEYQTIGLSCTGIIILLF